MSLSFDEFVSAHKVWKRMDKRLHELFGFNPATSNHYGCILLYNNRISEQTTDEEIIKIRADYLTWKNELIVILSELGISFDEEQLSKLFFVDGMFGTITFLGDKIDIHKSANIHRETISKLLSEKTPNNKYHFERTET